MMHLQAKEYQRWLAATRSKERDVEQTLPQSLDFRLLASSTGELCIHFFIFDLQVNSKWGLGTPI